MRAGSLLLLTATACASSVHLAPPPDVDDPAARAGLLAPGLEGYQADFLLLWDNARIGEAHEAFVADAAAAGGYRFSRSERVQVRRGGALATARTTIVIDTDGGLLARRVVVDRWTGPTRTHGEATRLLDDTWRVAFGSSPVRLVDGAAVPSTLVPLAMAAAGLSPGRAFDAPILVEGAGLAAARLSVDVDADLRQVRARVATAAGDLLSEARLDERGFIAEAGLGDGVASRRASPGEIAATFAPPEIVDSTAIPVAGAPQRGEVHLEVDGVRAPPPVLPELDEQRVALGPGGAWDVDVRRAPETAGLAEVRERTHTVSRMLGDDLGLAALAPEEAMAAGRGDCTAHAVVLGKLLGERGYATRIVTGFVLADGALRRHRWVLVRLERSWVPVDPMFDEVPASPAHLALAVHGPGLDELAFIDDVAFAGWDHARARLVP